MFIDSVFEFLSQLWATHSKRGSPPKMLTVYPSKAPKKFDLAGRFAPFPTNV